MLFFPFIIFLLSLKYINATYSITLTSDYDSSSIDYGTNDFFELEDFNETDKLITNDVVEEDFESVANILSPNQDGKEFSPKGVVVYEFKKSINELPMSEIGYNKTFDNEFKLKPLSIKEILPELDNIFSREVTSHKKFKLIKEILREIDEESNDLGKLSLEQGITLPSRKLVEQIKPTGVTFIPKEVLRKTLYQPTLSTPYSQRAESIFGITQAPFPIKRVNTVDLDKLIPKDFKINPRVYFRLKSLQYTYIMLQRSKRCWLLTRYFLKDIIFPVLLCVYAMLFQCLKF
ncbi:uncharacterized protein NDAI_0E01470 [Naumovozyma dairenensis CBS 421]|uniref:Uncharacterized protein n=1 Tax=Naumovozyma dairenensis (strain ATCC 10597 / BCRC 20456 / CBS 421 / NBRC 0211 / NRRL Y-12639) TaxID=1071378 RepID=G0WB43_NAUDC|nr:hypothetical protein NDAI_0E01470 [Naumovozyma dairenensis CBS 421]CCD24963.1 hypothetical protein NDAI_0E01470 [Naumovozyma dairenensis CBS 421]